MTTKIKSAKFKDLNDDFEAEALTIPPHQREFVWGKNQTLIDHLIGDILLGNGDYYYGTYVLNDIRDTSAQRTPVHSEEIEDGQQRFTTCRRFVKDEQWITKKTAMGIVSYYRQEYDEEINNEYTTEGRRKKLQKIVAAYASGRFPSKFYFSDLPRLAQRKFINHTVHIRRERLSADDKIKAFLRLQNHMPLQYGDHIHTMSDVKGGNAMASDVKTLIETCTASYTNPFPSISKISNIQREYNLGITNIIQSLMSLPSNKVDYARAGSVVVTAVHERGNHITKDPAYAGVYKNLKNGFIALADLENKKECTLKGSKKDRRLSRTYIKALLLLMANSWGDSTLQKYVKANGMNAFLLRLREVFDTAKNYKTQVNSGAPFNTASVANWNDWLSVYSIYAGQHNRAAIDRFTKSVINLL